jgi:AraC-like DNA-binding protein
MPLVLPGAEVGINEPGRTFARHHHLKAYAALVVSGCFDEAGDQGRFSASSGYVLGHVPFEAHRDQIGARGAKIINLNLEQPLAGPFGSVADLDLIVRTHERDPRQAALLLHDQFAIAPQMKSDWPDLLAAELLAPGAMRLDAWAESHGLNPSSLSRGFTLAYGITPKRFRFEQMVSRAARATLDSRERLSMIAASAGFADQAHMTRAFGDLFGTTPQRLRRLS